MHMFIHSMHEIGKDTFQSVALSKQKENGKRRKRGISKREYIQQTKIWVTKMHFTSPEFSES